MSKQDQDYMRQWASEHGKAVRQLSVRQNNTKHAAGTLPLNMYRKELPVGDRVTEEPSSADDIGDQLSEYDSDSSNKEDSAGGGTWVFFGWVCAARDSKLAPRSRKIFP